MQDYQSTVYRSLCDTESKNAFIETLNKQLEQINLSHDDFLDLINNNNIDHLKNPLVWNVLNFLGFRDAMDNLRTNYIFNIYKNGYKIKLDGLCDDVINYITNNTCINSNDPCENRITVVTRGHFKCLQYMHENNMLNDDKFACYNACYWGKIKMLKYLHENNYKFTDECCCSTAACSILNANAECLKYLHKHGCAISRECCKLVCQNGNLDAIAYLHENNYKFDLACCEILCENGNLDAIAYLHENNYKFDLACREILCENEHLECIKYLHNNGYVFDDIYAEFMSKNSLQYLHTICSKNKN